VPAITPAYPCQVVYILNNYYPHALPVIAPTSHEAAAIQAAIWNFTDGFVISGPAYVKTRALAIIAIWHVAYLVYDDFTPATVPTMATQVMIGDDVFMYKATWTQTKQGGWKLEFPHH
jgi:fibronectin-binding protein